jgi:hypothetical protein
MTLGPLESFRRNRVALTTVVALAGAAMLGSFSASAQEALNDAQCRQARTAAGATLKEYTGKMSAPLAESFGSFIQSCDLKTQFNAIPGTADTDALNALRIRLKVIRTSDIAKPRNLAQE